MTTQLALPNKLNADQTEPTKSDSEVVTTVEQAEQFIQDINKQIEQTFGKLRQLDPSFDTELAGLQLELQNLTYALREKELDYVVRAEGLDNAPLRTSPQAPSDLKKKCRKLYKRLAQMLHPDKLATPDSRFEKAKTYYNDLDLPALEFLYWTVVSERIGYKNQTLLDLERAALQKLERLKQIIMGVKNSMPYTIHNNYTQQRTGQALHLYCQFMMMQVQQAKQKVAKVKFILSTKQ